MARPKKEVQLKNEKKLKDYLKKYVFTESDKCEVQRDSKEASSDK